MILHYIHFAVKIFHLTAQYFYIFLWFLNFVVFIFTLQLQFLRERLYTIRTYKNSSTCDLILENYISYFEKHWFKSLMAWNQPIKA